MGNILIQRGAATGGDCASNVPIRRDPTVVWLVEGQGFPGGIQTNIAHVHADLASAIEAAHCGARIQAMVYRVSRCTLTGQGPAQHRLWFTVDSAARWGRVLTLEEDQLITQYHAMGVSAEP